MSRTSIARGREARRDDSGFTLIELLMVIVILGVLAAIVAFSVRGITDKGEVSACEAEGKTVAVAQEAYYAKTGKYAADAAALAATPDKFLRSGTTKYVTTDNTGAVSKKADAPGACNVS